MSGLANVLERIRPLWFVVVALLWVLVFCSYVTFYMTGIGYFYWFGAAFSFGAFALTVMESRRETYWLASLLLFMISQRTLLVLRLPSWGFSAFQYDASFNLQLASLIEENGEWIVNIGTVHAQAYSYHPALHLWTVILGKISGLDLFSAARLFIFLSPLLTLSFFYLAIRTVLNRETAVLAGFVYSMNETFIMFDHYVMESFALIFYTMCLYIFFHSYLRQRRNRRMILIWIIAVLSTVSAHHWTSYNLILTMGVLLVLPALYARLTSRLWNANSKNRFPSQMVIVGVTIVFTWIMFVSYPIFDMHTQWFSEFLTNLSVGGEVHRAPLHGRDINEIALIYFGQFVVIVTGILQFRRISFSPKESRQRLVLAAWFSFCLVYMVWATFFAPGGQAWTVLSRRNWEFTFLGLSPLVAMFIYRNLHVALPRKGVGYYLKRSTFLLLVFPLISTLLMHAQHIRDPDFPIPEYSCYSSAFWVRAHMPNELIAVDPIYGPTVFAYGRKEPIGAPWIWGATWPEESLGIELIYRRDNIGLFQNVLFNQELPKWYPDLLPNSSLYDQEMNRIFDSGSVQIFRRVGDLG